MPPADSADGREDGLADIRSPEPWPPGRVLVVTATYRESETIRDLCRRVLAVDGALQLLVVDDDSPDGTAGIVLDALRCQPRLHLLVRRGRRGLGSAIVEGFRVAVDHGFDVAVNMDADGSHDPDDIPRLLAALEPLGGEAAAVSLGSRRVPGGRIVGWPWSRHLASALVNWFSRIVVRIPARDASTGFRAVRLEAFASLRGPFEEGYAFQEDLLLHVHRAGGRIVEVPVTFTDRTAGESKAGFKQMAEGIAALLRMAVRVWFGLDRGPADQRARTGPDAPP